MTTEEMVVAGEKAIKVVGMLSSTSIRILQLLSQNPLAVTAIAEKLDLSEPYVSAQVSLLEKLKLIRASYESGRKGIRKICELTVKKIVILLKP
ncbi:MAG: ArsR family transcriptional regulator [Candidatus Bathyarchaeota archaeon]